MAKRKSILIVGVGSIGERHLRCFQATGRVDVSLCEVNPTLRKSVAEKYKVENVFDDLNLALEKQPDAAVICTPANVHIPIALAAAKKGVHLLIEKPLSTTLDGLEELQAEIRQRKLVAGVAYVFRAHPTLTAMRAAVRSGRFGEPVQVAAMLGQNFPFYRPTYQQTYYRSHDTGGGAVQDALTHVVNYTEWIVGPVDRLVADAAHQVLPGVEVEDTVHLITRHGPVLGSFSLNQHQAPNEHSIMIVCQNGTARFEMHNNRWRWQTDPGDLWHNETTTQLERDSLFILQAESFLEALDGIHPPLCPLEDGIQTLRVNLAILRSIKERQWQTLGATT